MNSRPGLEEIRQCSEWLRQRIEGEPPRIGIILGTGLGGLVRDAGILQSFEYSELPHFPVSTVESHQGRLLHVQLKGVPALIMQGRFHYYEGYSMQQITFPVRVMQQLGVKDLIVSNACGCVNPQFQRGDLMVMEDHINLLGDNPLIGPNLDELGPRFPDMSAPYDRELIALAEQLAVQLRIPLQKGVYTAVAGPNLETRAEYRMLRTMGSDVVGMSSVPECIVARHMGLRVLGFSIITDECFPEALRAVKLEEILAAAAGTEPAMTTLVEAIVEKLGQGA